MLKKMGLALAAALVLVGGLLAADAVVVSYDAKKDALTVTVDKKEKTLQLTKKLHVHTKDDKHVKFEDRAKVFKKGTKIEIVEKNGKLDEINLKD